MGFCAYTYRADYEDNCAVDTENKSAALPEISGYQREIFGDKGTTISQST